MTQAEKCEAFRALHVKGEPLILWNIWDAGSARAVAKAGARAIATGSWSVAAAQGFADGEALPLEDALRVAVQIVRAVDLPVSVDFEGGYAVAPDAVAKNVARLIDTGVAGINFEDRIVRGEGLHNPETQAARISAIRQTAEKAGVPLFINARTDVFFSSSKAPLSQLMEEVLSRAAIYAEAGADGLFVPGLSDPDLITEVCRAQPLPVNIMRTDEAMEIEGLRKSGVARISHGPGPYRASMNALEATALV